VAVASAGPNASLHLAPPLCFLQAECPSCRPTYSVKALKERALKALLYSLYYKKLKIPADYRWHVVGCADTGLGELCVGFKDARKTEVTNLDIAPGVEEYVGGFQITMQHDVSATRRPGVTLAKRWRHLLADLPDITLRHLWPAVFTHNK